MKAWLLALAALATLDALAAQAQPVPDTLAQRALACTGCHGKEGRAAPDGYYPRLAGKPAGYLYNQLLNFRDGRRDYGLMSELVTPLSDAYLQELAGHFAALDLPYPPPQKPTLPAPELARAEQLIRHGDAARRLPACTACHGERLTGTQPAVPGLLGLSRDYLNGQLGAWRSGQRRAQAPDCMAQIAKALTATEINAVTQFLAGQALPADAHPAAALPAPAPMRCGGLQP
ncbi:MULTISPECIES: c-type cytochrome [Roseateles]|uniref:Cytochrome c553 n=1 Tax=Pelomonas aquatica TaxID=431058 RepID=A0ABU1ZF03_9BURK|nr:MULTISPECIES: c-type cytochrome [Roseateles]KQY86878.1 cytochrome C [Pelomonas sp. Root1444]MDR7299173.1 cytochrome c553 [Pelomonas aquatica]